jgi:hypothetical protein
MLGQKRISPLGLADIGGQLTTYIDIISNHIEVIYNEELICRVVVQKH